MKEAEKKMESLQEKELSLRILKIFYHNVHSLCLGVSILFMIFILGHLSIIKNENSALMILLNGITVIITVAIMLSIKYRKLPIQYTYLSVLLITILVFLNAATYMNLNNDILWMINIILILFGVGVFLLSFRWFLLISTIIVLLSIVDIMIFDITLNIKTPLILLFLTYYLSFLANFLRLNSTKKFQQMYLESQNNQIQMKNILNEFTQAKNFAETINQVVPSAVFTIDLNNRITSWNNKAEEITGFSFVDVIGKLSKNVFMSEEFEIEFSSVDEEYKILDKECDVSIKSGKIIKILFSLDLLENEDFYGAIISFEDITERKLAEEKLAKSEKQYRTLQSNIPLAVYRSTYDGHLLSVNPAMVNMFGYDSEDDLKNAPADALYANSKSRAVFINEINEKGNVHSFELEVKKKDGTPFWVGINSKAIQQRNNIIYYDGVMEDITLRKEAEDNLALRDKILQALTVSSNTFLTKSNWEENMASILAKYGEVLDVSRVYIIKNVEDDLGLMQMRFVHGWQSEQAKKYPINVDVNSDLSYKNLGFSSWQNDLLRKKTIFGIVEEMGLENKLLENNYIKSILIIPIFVKEVFWGIIVFDDLENQRIWKGVEVESLTMVAESFGAAVNRQANEDNLNQMYNSLVQELDVASSVQQYLLPDWLAVENDLIFSSTYKPSSLIGGDLFDIIQLSETKSIVYVGDISGHGVQAALMMTAVKSIINMIISSKDEEIKPSYIIHRLNKILSSELFYKNYLTMLLCVVDNEKQEIRYFNAGHPALLEYDLQSQEVSLIDEKGAIPIGWSANFNYEEEDEGVVSFNDNKVFMLYTDGIFECENKLGEQFGINGFKKIIQEQADLSSSISFPGKFKQKLEDLNYDITTDDFTLISFSKIKRTTGIKYKKIFTIKSLLENIKDIGQECYNAIVESLVEDTLALKVEILINEYLNNIIKHGLKGEKNEIIGMELIISDKITITFWDKGIEWELPEENEDELKATIDRIGGFGMQIIYTVVSNISLRRYDDLNESIIEIEYNKDIADE
ncbi:MAG: PAS domain S-box protein [Candidatus Cloacimonetes bacterium]|nr:PAS domain S-box protein [Candidatus Cloacimonadota bacterium]